MRNLCLSSFREKRTKRGCNLRFRSLISQRHMFTTKQAIYWGYRIMITKIINYSKISKNLSMNGK